MRFVFFIYIYKGTLFEFLDKTKTAMGRRLFRNWIASPLCRPSAIYKRLDAVEDLCELFIEREDLRKKLAKIPDLEKLESTIHTLVRSKIEKNEM